DVAVFRVDAHREAVSSHSAFVLDAWLRHSDSERGLAEAQTHIRGLALGWKSVSDRAAEQVTVEAERAGHVTGGQDRECFLGNIVASTVSDERQRPQVS